MRACVLRPDPELCLGGVRFWMWIDEVCFSSFWPLHCFLGLEFKVAKGFAFN